jgi:predicted nucleic acid-binding Zn ribbon protein
MAYSRTCPVCSTPGSIIRPDTKTCSRDCSKLWGKMTRGEQQARIRAVNPDIDAEVTRLKAEIYKSRVVDEVVDEDKMLEESDDQPEDEPLIPSGYRTK